MIRKGHNYTLLNWPRYVSITSTIKSVFQKTNQIKIVTYNIKYAKKIDQAIKLIKSNAELENTDVFLLQEMDLEGVKKIAKELNYDYVYYPAVKHPVPDQDFGNAILTRWPIVHDTKFIFEDIRPNKLQRIAVGATLLIDGTEIEVYSLHMDIFLEAHERQFQLEKFLESLDEQHKTYIIGGDFNTFSKKSRNTVYAVFKQNNFELASKDIIYTFNPWYFFSKKVKLDYIFTKGSHVVKAGKIPDKKASDHMPIWVELTLKNSPEPQ